MPENDFIYDPVLGWLLVDAQGGRIPLSESTDPFDQAVWNILRQIRIEPSYTDEDLQAILDSAEIAALAEFDLPAAQAEAQARFEANAPKASQEGDVPPRPPGWVGPWPLMTKAVPEKKIATGGKFYTEPAIPAGPDFDRMNAAINSLGLAYVQDPTTGEWGYQRQSDLLKKPAAPAVPAPLIFDTRAGAEAEVAINGGVVVRRSDGRWGVEDAPVERTQPAETFEETFTRYLVSGQREKAQQLWDAREAIIGRGGQMTRAEAAQFLTGDLFKAEEIPGLLQALMGPEPTFQEAARLPGPNGEPGNVSFGGFFGPTVPPRILVPGAAGQGGELGNLPSAFPPIPVDAGWPGMLGMGAFNPQGALDTFQSRLSTGLNPQAPGSFTQAIQADLAAVTNTQRAQVQAAAQQVQAATPKGPLFASINPQAQEEWEAQGGVGPAPVFQAPAGQPVDTTGLAPSINPQAQAEWEAEGGVGPAPVFQAPAGQPVDTTLTEAPAAATSPAWFQQAYEAQGGAARKGVFQVPEGQNPWDAAVALSQTPEGRAQAESIRNAPQWAREGRKSEFEELPEPVAVQQAPRPMTFSEALAQRNQRLRHLQLLRKPQGRTIFA